MKNIFKIFISDVKRIFQNVVAVVVIMGLCVIPCLYAWFNIFSNWDPYGESSTSNLKVAGFMLGAKAGGASVQTGYGYEMEAIAACTIGGVSVTGGRGKVSSAIIGVAVFELLKVALQYLGMNANAQYIAIGVVIFVAISLDIRKYIARK